MHSVSGTCLLNGAFLFLGSTDNLWKIYFFQFMRIWGGGERPLVLITLQGKCSEECQSQSAQKMRQFMCPRERFLFWLCNLLYSLLSIKRKWGCFVPAHKSLACNYKNNDNIKIKNGAVLHYNQPSFSGLLEFLSVYYIINSCFFMVFRWWISANCWRKFS